MSKRGIKKIVSGDVDGPQQYFQRRGFAHSHYVVCELIPK